MNLKRIVRGLLGAFDNLKAKLDDLLTVSPPLRHARVPKLVRVRAR